MLNVSELTANKPFKCPVRGTIGVFTPSSPAHTKFRSRFDTALTHLETLGFRIVLGDLTASFQDQGYRTASGRERAEELNKLFRRADVDLVMPTIGGSNSSSMLEFLDYEAIGASRKIFCGYSDVTSLHMAINTIAGLSTLYGPAIVPSFGDVEGPAAETLKSFLEQVCGAWSGAFEIAKRWSNQGAKWGSESESEQGRQWQANPGLVCLQPGRANGLSLAVNLNTLVSIAGTRYFPDCRGRVLFLEEMSCPLSRFERNLYQLKLAGVFDGLSGIVLSKPEFFDAEGAPFDDRALLVEVVDDPSIPIIGGFDCGHTHPMLSVPQAVEVEIEASRGGCTIRQLGVFAEQQRAREN